MENTMTLSMRETNGLTSQNPTNSESGGRAARASAFLFLIAGLACFFATTPARAANAEAQMTVSARVLARAVVTLENSPSSINITSDDISRGFVEIAAPITVRVKTNSRAGYLLTVSRLDDSFSAVNLSFGNAEMHVAAAEGWIARPYVASGDILSVNARLTLAPGTTPGVHSTPFAFSASPI
jgi:hypothetical protein